MIGSHCATVGGRAVRLWGVALCDGGGARCATLLSSSQNSVSSIFSRFGSCFTVAIFFRARRQNRQCHFRIWQCHFRIWQCHFRIWQCHFGKRQCHSFRSSIPHSHNPMVTGARPLRSSDSHRKCGVRVRRQTTGPQLQWQKPHTRQYCQCAPGPSIFARRLALRLFPVSP